MNVVGNVLGAEKWDGYSWANEKKAWKFSRATLGFCQAEQVEGTDG